MQGWVDFAQSYPKSVLTLASLIAGISLVYAAGRLGFQTNRSDLVHPSKASSRNWKYYSEEFGGESDLVVIVTGSDRSKLISALETLARQIEAFPRHFEKLCYRLNTEQLRRKGLYQLPTDDLRVIRDAIEKMQPVLMGSWDLLSTETMLQACRFQIEFIREGEPFSEDARQQLLSTAQLAESLARFLRDGREYRSPWRELFGKNSLGRFRPIPKYFLADDGKMAFLRVVPVRDEKSFVGLREPIKILRGLIERTEPLFPDLGFGLTGLPVLEDDEMNAAKSASTTSLLLTIVGVTILFITAFRAIRHPAFVMVTLLLCACWTLGWVTLTVGHLNVLSVSFIVTLVGLGVDFGILWLSRYEANRTRGFSVSKSNVEAAGSVGPGILVGALTTALAFLTTMLTGFLGLSEMGWIAGSGVVLCLIGTFTVLPALLALAGGAPIHPDRGRWDDLPALPFVVRHPILSATSVVSIIVALGCWIPKLQFDYNLLNLQARGLASVEWEKRLVNQTGASAWYALSISNSAEEARRSKREFEKLPTVGRVVEIASMIPPDQPEKQPIIREIHSLLRDLPSKDHVPALFLSHSENLLEQLAELSQLGLPEEPQYRTLTERLIEGARSAEEEIFGLGLRQRADRLARYEKLWIRDLLSELWKLRSASDPEPITVADLPPSLRERYYSRSGKWLLQIFATSNVWDLEPLRQFRDEVSSVDSEVTGKSISTLYALQQMTSGYQKCSWLVTLVVFAAVWLDFRSLAKALLAMLPLALGCIGMFGTMGLLGIDLNPANMIALPLILGIGVDFGIHVMHDYAESQGPYYLSWRLGRALLLTSLTTIVAFSSLWTARHWGMVSIGLVLSIGVFFCTLSVLFVLPAVLHLLSRDRQSSILTPLPETFIPNRSLPTGERSEGKIPNVA